MFRSIFNSTKTLLNSTTYYARKGTIFAGMTIASGATCLVLTDKHPIDLTRDAEVVGIFAALGASVGCITGAAYGFANGMKEIVTSSSFFKGLSETAEKNIGTVMGAAYTAATAYATTTILNADSGNATYIISNTPVMIVGAVMGRGLVACEIKIRKKLASSKLSNNHATLYQPSAPESSVRVDIKQKPDVADEKDSDQTPLKASKAL